MTNLQPAIIGEVWDVDSLHKGNAIQAVRSSCREAVEKSELQISKEGVTAFIANLEKHQYEELAIDTPIRMPVRFDSMAQELNFIALIDLLNFGSGYRVPLHKYTGRGAFDTIRFGAMSFHIGGTPLTAQTYKDMTAFEVSEVFQFPIDREYQPEGMSFVTMTEPNELKPLAIGIAQVLNSTGEFLLSHGYQDFATFILDITKPTDGNLPSVKKFVDQVYKLIIIYVTMIMIDLAALYIYKKAQILAYHIWLIFRDQDHARFDFTDIEELTIFSDNVIPTMLEHLKVIVLPEALKQKIEQGQELTTQEAYLARAAAVVACEEIVKQARSDERFSKMTEGGLDVYLWRLGKVGEYRKIVRLQLQNTVMF
ncbi:hypothetical protein NQZ79_g8844 [Umbelopsis isabellina]|nr:hypothetical protein NQZ79_g8844 [Umbelopsis isabellina]